MASYFTILTIIALVLSVSSQQTKKDVLFLAFDDLRPELGAYGFDNIKSPNFDALAAKSMVFERAYCQVAVCSPSRASLLTGRRPDTNHVWKIADDEYWRNYTNATTIPQYFKENGYVSVGMGKIFHPGAPSGNDDIKYSWSLPYFHGKNKVGSPNSWHRFENISDNDLRDGQIADNAVETLKQIKKNRTEGNNTPFFVAVGFHKPHLPFFAPAKYYDMYPPAEDIKPPLNPDAPMDMPPIAWSTSGELRSYEDMHKYRLPECYSDAQASISGEGCRVSESDAKLLRRAYYSALTFTDAQVGRVLQELETQGLADNTIIVVWADHGWKLGEHNMWAKHTNFEDDTHVTFMLRVPGVTDSGMRTKALVELIDIFPTLAELAGIRVPALCPSPEQNNTLACVEGSSVVPLLKNPTQQWKKAAFSQFSRPYAGLSSIPGKPPFDKENHGEDIMGYSIRVDQYRFTEWYKFDRNAAKADFGQIWGTELYDHTQPTVFFNDDNTNMANDPNMQETVAELRKMLQEGWRNAMPPPNKKKKVQY